jgi:hypothetical protein
MGWPIKRCDILLMPFNTFDEPPLRLPRMPYCIFVWQSSPARRIERRFGLASIDAIPEVPDLNEPYIETQIAF